MSDKIWQWDEAAMPESAMTVKPPEASKPAEAMGTPEALKPAKALETVGTPEALKPAKALETLWKRPGQREGRNETIRLSKRLEAVAGMVTEGNIVCDVGCDHGFVPMYLIRKAISPKAIAMDVNSGPLQAAKEHILNYGMQDCIEIRLSDGVEALKDGEADSLICAGMGGRLMIHILEEGKRKIRSMEEVILQPQSEIRSVREYLRKEGYLIVDENMILEEEKFYTVIKAEPAKMQPAGGHSENIVGKWRDGEGSQCMDQKQRVEDKYGPVLLMKKNHVLEMFLRREYDLCMEIMEELRKNGKDKRQEEIAGRIRDIEKGLSYFDLS